MEIFHIIDVKFILLEGVSQGGRKLFFSLISGSFEPSFGQEFKLFSLGCESIIR